MVNTGYLESKMRRMFIWSPAAPIVVGQCVALFAVAALHVSIDLPFWYAFVFLVAFAWMCAGLALSMRVQEAAASPAPAESPPPGPGRESVGARR